MAISPAVITVLVWCTKPRDKQSEAVHARDVDTGSSTVKSDFAATVRSTNLDVGSRCRYMVNTGEALGQTSFTALMCQTSQKLSRRVPVQKEIQKEETGAGLVSPEN